jgi:hypothetical protein
VRAWSRNWFTHIFLFLVVLCYSLVGTWYIRGVLEGGWVGPTMLPRQMSGQYLGYSKTASFQILPGPSFINYLTCKIWGFQDGGYEECRLLGCGAV